MSPLYFIIYGGYIMENLNIRNEFKDIKFNSPDDMLVKGSMMPFNASNSGSRKLMFGTHLEQRLNLSHPQVPYIQTGHEMEFGLHSSSIIIADRDFFVFDKIYKFSNNPNHHFFLICIDEIDKKICVFENKRYKHVTGSYGYMYCDDTYVNFIEPGHTITKGSTIMKSKAFDEYENRMDGINLLTAYSSLEENMEDAIIMSESAAKSFSSPLIKVATIKINDNNIPLNLYGDNTVYKSFPDIGEEIKNGILCAVRSEKKEESLYTLSYNRLRDIMISDEKYTLSGRVVDVNVYCNNPANLDSNPYCEQIARYYHEYLDMCSKIVNDVEVELESYLKNGYTMDYDMQKLYSTCKRVLSGKQYYSNGKVFSNLILEIAVVDEIDIFRGDKVTNRYGGKGVTSRILPDNMMPVTHNGKRIDVLLNMCSVYGRENAGQLFEISVNYISMKLVDYFKTECLDVGECIDMYLRLLKYTSPSMYKYMCDFFSNCTDDEAMIFIQSIMDDVDDSCIYLVIEPMSENMSLEKLQCLYNEFPWIKPEKVYVPLVDSNGDIRYIDSRRPIVYGYQYFYRLKQYAQDKFSVTSLSSTNEKNENAKNKASNSYKALYPRTPIRFGEMEIGNLCHANPDLISQVLMLYSSSPLARKLFEQLQTGDPFNIDIKLDMNSKNRNAEILNVYLKTKGLKLTFKKYLKKRKSPMRISPMMFKDKHVVDPIIFYNKDEKFNLDEAIDHMKETRDGLIHPMIFSPMIFDDIILEEDK